MEKNHKLHPENICSVILAAGLSSRMGEFKPLLKIGGISAIKRLINANKGAGINNIIVVTGNKREELEEHLKAEKVETVFNPDFKKGMFTSICAGVKKATELGEFSSVLLFPVDIPLINKNIIEKQLLSCGNGDNYCVPTYEGKKGHPLLIPIKYAEEIINHDGKGGLKAVTNKYEDNLIKVETHDEAVVLDMDVPEDYEYIKDYYNLDKRSFSNRDVTEKKEFEGKLYLVRHGSTVPHKGKIFMGQIDIPLSDKGREEILEVSEILIKNEPKTKVIYASPLVRAEESAQIIRERFLLENDEKSIIETPRFMEIALGDWDGKYIDEIKEKYPLEYEKRGKNLLTYKRPPDGENYYDLRYRVIKELKKIIKETTVGEDLIIVTHIGVIDVIIEYIYGFDSDQLAGQRPPKGSVTICSIKDTEPNVSYYNNKK